MTRFYGREFLPQFFALILSALIIHSFFSLVIRPEANAQLHEAEQLNLAAPRTISILLKDYEQEACFILLFWSLGIIGLKVRDVHSQHKLLGSQYLKLDDGVSILPDDTKDHSRSLQSLGDDEKEALLPRVLLSALDRFGSSMDIRSAAEAAKNTSVSEADRLEAELSMVRYIAWAIPSIGFIGTVRGIGEALGKAGEAISGNIAGITESLGVAFNSTLVALMISILLMFLLHQLQLMQDRLVLGVDEYCERNLLARFRETSREK